MKAMQSTQIKRSVLLSIVDNLGREVFKAMQKTCINFSQTFRKTCKNMDNQSKNLHNFARLFASFRKKVPEPWKFFERKNGDLQTFASF